MLIPGTRRPADLALLGLLLLMPVLAGRAIGWSMDDPGIARAAALLAVWAGYQGAFLVAVVRSALVAPALAGAFAWRIQAQAAMQIVLFAVGVLTIVYIVDSLAAEAPDPDMAAQPALNLPLAALLLQMTPVASISLAWWRCRAWIRGGGAIDTVLDGAYQRAHIALAASVATAALALERRLDRLADRTAARYRSTLLQTRMSVARATVGDDDAWILTWPLLSLRATLTLISTGPGTAELRIRYALRGGVHRLELYPNPAGVLSLMRHLHTQLLGPLASELALAGAVRRQDELRQQAVESQLRILQAQIEPHFLFNTLANVRHLYRSSVDEGEAMMDHLILYLRSTLDELRSDVSTVRKEMALALHYLAIMKMRMGERLSYGFIQPDDTAALAFPPAMLIALVENAIMHGLHSQPDGRLTISAAREGGQLRMTVLDNGPGFSSVQGSGVGLSTIRQRLEAIHGNDAWLEVGAMAGGGFTASIIIPISHQG